MRYLYQPDVQFAMKLSQLLSRPLSGAFPALALAVFLSSCGTSKETVSSASGADAAEVVEAVSSKSAKNKFNGDESSPFVEGKYNGSATKEFDLLHTSLEIAFDWPNAHVLGKATLTLSPWFYNQDELVLDAKGFVINSVILLEGERKQELEYDYKDDVKLHISLPREYKKGEEVIVWIDYVARPNELPEGGSMAISSDKGLYFINEKGEDPNKPTQLWTQGETEASSCWFPTIDKPNARTTQEMFITVDDKYTTLSNGSLKEKITNEDGTRTDHWVMDKPHAPYLFMMAVSDFAVVEDEWRGMPVDYYVDEEYAQYADLIFGNTPEMMTFYSDYLGVDYPWSKYAQVVVHDFVSGAMENTSATIHFDGLHMTDREHLDETHEDIIAHELFHHWFGDLVTCESWANLPLNESFATYGEYLWIEYKYGREEADLHIKSDMDMYLMEASRKQEDMIRYDYEDKEDMFDGHSYQKGGRILHMLRSYIGDDAFRATLKNYLEDHAYSDVEIHELRMAAEEVTGEDLNWFFSQWFLSSGHPSLRVRFEDHSEEGYWEMTVKQVQKREETPVYILPFDVDLYSNDEVTRKRFRMEKREETYRFDAADVDWINFDAEKVILGKVDVKMPEEWHTYALQNGPLYVDRYQSLAWFAETANDENGRWEKVYAALDDKFWAIQNKAISELSVGDGTPSWIAEKLADLSRSHDKSDIRAAAVRKLGQYKDDVWADIFRESMQDPSWMVGAAGLTQLGKVDASEALKVASAYESEDNTSMMMSVMNLYSDYGGNDKDAYFRAKLVEVGGWQQYLVIQSYGDFLKRMEDETLVAAGSEVLANAAMESDIWWMSQVAQGVLRDIKSQYEGERDALADSGMVSSEKEKLDVAIEILDGLLDEISN